MDVLPRVLEPPDASSDPADGELTTGGMLDGRFVIERVLGRGGMGDVLLAKHVELQQRVAIKILRSRAADEPRQVSRVLREARAVARIQSEHVVKVHDVATGHTVPYIVMEYLKGQDLSQWLAQRGPLPVETAAAIVIQAAEAIGEGHGLGIVHRDLKPANLFLCERAGAEPRVKVLDFGISKSLGDEAELTTQSYALLGSPFYTAPEQLECSRAVDGRADIWSLGVILYEMVSAQRPFASGSLAQVCTRILQEPPAPLARARPRLPRAFIAVVMRCLEKDPARRFQSVAELVSALSPFEPGAAATCLAYLGGLETGSSGFSRSVLPAPERKTPSDAATLTISRRESVSSLKPDARRPSNMVMMVVAASAILLPVLVRGSFSGADAAPTTPVPALLTTGTAIPSPAAAGESLPLPAISASVAVSKPAEVSTSVAKPVPRRAKPLPASSVGVPTAAREPGAAQHDVPWVDSR